MQIRDLLILILRIFGIYILLFMAIPMLIANMAYLSNSFSLEEVEIVIYLFGTVILPVCTPLLLIFGSSWLINLFKLDKGFQSDEVLLNNTSQQQLLQLAIILIGGFLIVDNLTNTLSHIAEAFRQSQHGFENTNYHNFWQSGLSLFIGALLIANRQALAKWLMPKTEE